MSILESTRFVTGINYWPRTKAMTWWKHFDAAEVNTDFALISELGFEIVRIFLMWEDFQPDHFSVSRTALDKLETVCDLAVEHHLKLNITFFTGHMSAANWPPIWLLNGRPPLGHIRNVSSGTVVVSDYENPYINSFVIEAQKRLLKVVIEKFSGHPAISLWNLGNEPDLFARPLNDSNGETWTREMVSHIKKIDQKHPVTLGLHYGDLAENTGLRADLCLAACDISVMHAYPMYSNGIARHPLDPDFVPFTCALTSALSGRPVLMEEFGGCTTSPGRTSETWQWQVDGSSRSQFMASEEDLADYFRAVLPKLHRNGVLGAIIWCFADYAPHLWGTVPFDHALHERFFGIVRPDGSLKAHAEVLRLFNSQNLTVQPIPAYAQLKIDPEMFYQAPQSQLKSLYQEYLARQPMDIT